MAKPTNEATEVLFRAVSNMRNRELANVRNVIANCPKEELAPCLVESIRKAVDLLLVQARNSEDGDEFVALVTTAVRLGAVSVVIGSAIEGGDVLPALDEYIKAFNNPFNEASPQATH